MPINISKVLSIGWAFDFDSRYIVWNENANEHLAIESIGINKPFSSVIDHASGHFPPYFWVM